jgi:hypothetical protein
MFTSLRVAAPSIMFGVMLGSNFNVAGRPTGARP